MSFVETFKALSDPVRREILQLLKNGPMSAGDIGSHFDMTGATVSYHLKLLKKADLIWETKEKNYIFYELNTSVLEEIMLWISDLKGDNEDAGRMSSIRSRRYSRHTRNRNFTLTLKEVFERRPLFYYIS